MRLDGGDLGEAGFLLEKIEGGQRRGTGERVGHVGRAMHEGVFCPVRAERGENMAASNCGGQRQGAAGQRLRETHQVGHDAGAFTGEQGAGAAEAGHDFVGDQQHPMLVATGADAGECRRVMKAHAAGALYAWLDDDSGDFMVMRGQQGLEGGVCRGIARQLGKQLRHAIGVAGIVKAAARIGDGQGAERIAVVAVAKGQEAMPVLSLVAPVLEGDFQRHLDRHRAGFRKEHAVERSMFIARHQRGKPPRQRLPRLVDKPRKHDMRQLVELGMDGGADLRVVVAVTGGPPRRDTVDQAAAVGKFDAHARGGNHRQRRRCRRHLRVG